MSQSGEPVVLGRFVQSGGDLGAFALGKEKLPKEYEKHLDMEVIERVNVEGISLDCNRTYRDFQNDNEELAGNQAFHSTRTLENFLAEAQFEPLRKTVVARCSAMCSLIFPISFLQAIHSRRVTFRKKGNMVFLETDSDYYRSHDTAANDPFAISAELIVKENVFLEDDEPSIGDNCVYRVLQHSLGDVDLIVSKEYDAVDENDEPLEIRGIVTGGQLALSKFFFKSLFLGGTNKAAINVLKNNHIVQIHLLDSLKAMDKRRKVEEFREKTRDVLTWLFKFIEETKAEGGELLSCEAGIIAKEGFQGDGNRRYSIFNKKHPTAFMLYDEWVKPRVRLMGTRDLPFLEGEIMRGSDFGRPCIYYFCTRKDTDLMTREDHFVFAQCYLRPWQENEYDYPPCDILRSAQFIHFLENIHPGSIPLQPRGPHLCIAPFNFSCSVESDSRFHISRSVPWTHADGEMNYIIFAGKVEQLCKLLSLHRWLSEERKRIPLQFTVISLGEFPGRKDHIRHAMGAIGEFTEENLAIHLYEGVILMNYVMTTNAENILSLRHSVVCVSPFNFFLPIDKRRFELVRGNPWSLNEKKMNYVVFYGGVDHLIYTLSLHKWLKKEGDGQKTADLTVISMNEPPNPKESIEEIIERFEKDQNSQILLEVKSLSTDPTEYQPLLAEVFGYKFNPSDNSDLIVEPAVSHKLYLIGENGIINKMRQNYDIQLVTDFIENGLLPMRKRPTEIEVVGNDEEMEKVTGKWKELCLSIPISLCERQFS